MMTCDHLVNTSMRCKTWSDQRMASVTFLRLLNRVSNHPKLSMFDVSCGSSTPVIQQADWNRTLTSNAADLKWIRLMSGSWYSLLKNSRRKLFGWKLPYAQAAESHVYFQVNRANLGHHVLLNTLITEMAQRGQLAPHCHQRSIREIFVGSSPKGSLHLFFFNFSFSFFSLGCISALIIELSNNGRSSSFFNNWPYGYQLCRPLASSGHSSRRLVFKILNNNFFSSINHGFVSFSKIWRGRNLFSLWLQALRNMISQSWSCTWQSLYSKSPNIQDF